MFKMGDRGMAQDWSPIGGQTPYRFTTRNARPEDRNNQEMVKRPFL